MFLLNVLKNFDDLKHKKNAECKSAKKKYSILNLKCRILSIPNKLKK